MIVEYDARQGLRLLEPDDFRAFKVLLRGAFDTLRPEIQGVAFVDDGNALVGIDVVPGLPGAHSGPEWRAGYDKMVEAAAKYGWIDDASRSIRAHVEREP